VNLSLGDNAGKCAQLMELENSFSSNQKMVEDFMTGAVINLQVSGFCMVVPWVSTFKAFM